MTFENVAAVVVNYNADNREQILAWLRDVMAESPTKMVQDFARDIYMRMLVPPASDLVVNPTAAVVYGIQHNLPYVDTDRIKPQEDYDSQLVEDET